VKDKMFQKRKKKPRKPMEQKKKKNRPPLQKDLSKKEKTPKVGSVKVSRDLTGKCPQKIGG